MSRVGVASCHAAQRWCSPLAPAARRPAPSGTRGCAAPVPKPDRGRAARRGARGLPPRVQTPDRRRGPVHRNVKPDDVLLDTTSPARRPRRSGSIAGSSCSCLPRARLGRSGLTDESPRSSCSGRRKVLYILYFFSFDSTANGLTEKKVYPRHF
jgi:hypothetical protein